MEYLKPFFIGGIIVSSTKYVSNNISPKLGPLIAGIPLGIISIFFLNNDSDKIKFYQGYIYTSIILTLVVCSIYFLSKSFENILHNYVNIISIIGLFLWIFLSYLAINYI
jgi:hypothetical protein